MAENRFGCGCTPPPTARDTCCIDTGRIYDSCRDRDCYENVRVTLTDCGNEIISRTGNIRAKDAYIAWTYIGVDPVRFNRGFYTVNIRFFIKITFEACIGSNRPQEFEGIATIDKRVVLFGGESNVSVFKSDPENAGLCPKPDFAECEHKAPTAVVEVIDPIILSANVLERSSLPICCCCCSSDVPDCVLEKVSAPLSDCDADGGRFLAVSVGIFSVIRLVRPAQLLINAVEYSVPDKECIAPPEENPCSIFKSMAFPVKEFNPPISCNTQCEKNRCNS